MRGPHSVCNRRADCVGLSRTICAAKRFSASLTTTNHAFGNGRVGDPCRSFVQQAVPSETIDRNSSGLSMVDKGT